MKSERTALMWVVPRKYVTFRPRRGGKVFLLSKRSEEDVGNAGCGFFL